jgi:hypothetical protein
MTSQAPQAPPEQITYANLLFYGSWGAIAILLITFFVYVSGVFESYIPINEISQYWSMPVSQYVQEANIPIGWGWATLIGKGDFLDDCLLYSHSTLLYKTERYPLYGPHHPGSAGALPRCLRYFWHRRSLASFRQETALFRNLFVNLRNFLCDVPRYVSAQFLDFLDLAKNCSFLARKLTKVHPGFSDGH